MKKRVAQIVVSTVLGIMLLFSQMAPGQASILGEKKDELSRVNSQIEQRKEQLHETQKQRIHPHRSEQQDHTHFCRWICP
jgi:hypothetical protein